MLFIRISFFFYSSSRLHQTIRCPRSIKILPLIKIKQLAFLQCLKPDKIRIFLEYHHCTLCIIVHNCLQINDEIFLRLIQLVLISFDDSLSISVDLRKWASFGEIQVFYPVQIKLNKQLVKLLHKCDVSYFYCFYLWNQIHNNQIYRMLRFKVLELPLELYKQRDFPKKIEKINTSVFNHL